MNKQRKVLHRSNGLLFSLTLISIFLIAGVSIWSYDFYTKLQENQMEIQTKIDHTLEKNKNAGVTEIEKEVIVREVPLQNKEAENLKETVSNLTNKYDRVTKETTDNILNQFARNEQFVQEMITNIQKQIDQIKADGANQEAIEELEKILENLKNRIKEVEEEGFQNESSLKSEIEKWIELLETQKEEIENLRDQMVKNQQENIQLVENEVEIILQLIEESQTKMEQILMDYENLRGRFEEVEKKILECFQSVSDGKKLLAAAITGKGIQTAATDDFAMMAQNITGLITMSSDPNVLFNINSWTAPEDCIAVMSFSVTMECNSDYKQTSTVTLSGVREWKFEWGPMSSSDTGWHTRGTSGNCTFEAKKGQTYTLSFDPGTSDYLTYGWGPRTWIVPSTRGYSAMPFVEEDQDDFHKKILEAEQSPEYNRLLEKKEGEVQVESTPMEESTKEPDSKEGEASELEPKTEEDSNLEDIIIEDF